MSGEASVMTGAPVVVLLVLGPRLGPQLWGARRVGGCKVSGCGALGSAAVACCWARPDFGPPLMREIRPCALRMRSWGRGSAVCEWQTCACAALPWRV